MVWEEYPACANQAKLLPSQPLSPPGREHVHANRILVVWSSALFVHGQILQSCQTPDALCPQHEYMVRVNTLEKLQGNQGKNKGISFESLYCGMHLVTY
jgi:hypothetical protein